jgi:hypothetical protein
MIWVRRIIAPAEASLLVGHNHAFETRFRYPEWKPAG